MSDAIRSSGDLVVERIERRAIVSLKVARREARTARERLSLAAPLRVTTRAPMSYWIGPDHWLLMSGDAAGGRLIELCKDALREVVHNAVDMSAGLTGLRLSGSGAADVLAGGTAVDLRPGKFGAGSCARTRLAQIPALIAALDDAALEVWIERSFETWFREWLKNAAAGSAAGTM